MELGQNGSFLPKGETLFEQTIIALDTSYNWKFFSVSLEYYHMELEDNPDMNPPISFNVNPEPYPADAFFIQSAFYLSDSLTGVLRYESLDFELNSTYFDVLGIQTLTRNVIGLNWDMGPTHSLRLELSQSETPLREDHAVTAQWFVILI